MRKAINCLLGLLGLRWRERSVVISPQDKITIGFNARSWKTKDGFLIIRGIDKRVLVLGAGHTTWISPGGVSKQFSAGDLADMSVSDGAVERE